MDRLLIITATIGLIGIALYYNIIQDPEFGGNFEGDRLALMKQSPHYDIDHFKNIPPQIDYDIWVNIKDMMGGQVRVPPKQFPIKKMEITESPEQSLTAYWLGHAAVLVEIEGYRILTDPMLSEYAFPVKMVAPKRFNPSPISVHNLPKIDLAIISHDHYDHLDMSTIKHLAKYGTHFFVGLGVGAHLEKWEVQKNQIHELDWWQMKKHGDLEVHCTPARHYSGRRSMDNSTLWTSWVIKGSKHSIFHSGDSGYSDHFKEIGAKLGPIDLTLVKIGDYGLDLGWQDIHMIPENSVKAHLDVDGKIMLPIHWGAFALSNHDWDEPIERAVAAANKEGVAIVTPLLGEKVIFEEKISNSSWWREIN